DPAHDWPITFEYLNATQTGAYLDQFHLQTDTTDGASTSTDGSTHTDILVGHVAGITDFSNVSVEIQPNVTSLQVHFDSGSGDFYFDTQWTVPGFYSFKARINDAGSNSGWITVNFVHDPDDSSPQALALVAAFAAADPNWQTNENFDPQL